VTSLLRVLVLVQVSKDFRNDAWRNHLRQQAKNSCQNPSVQCAKTSVFNCSMASVRSLWKRSRISKGSSTPEKCEMDKGRRAPAHGAKHEAAPADHGGGAFHAVPTRRMIHLGATKGTLRWDAIST
jgi:hypothetical protein